MSSRPVSKVLEQEMVWMKEHLSTLGSPVVLCHNDLLCKNIIHNSKEGRYWYNSRTQVFALKKEEGKKAWSNDRGDVA